MRFKRSEITQSRVYHGAVNRLKDLPDALAWRSSSFAASNAGRLERYRDRHHGQRCFVLANGPSLASVDVSRLAGEWTFSMNRAYLMYEQWGFTPSYYVCSNPLVIEQFREDIKQLPIPRFVNFASRGYFRGEVEDQRLMYLRVAFSLRDRFRPDATKPISSGGTVTFTCLQLAFFMGFHEVVIIGMDHTFMEKGIPSKIEVRQTARDESHCHPDYFPKGIRWQLPDLLRSEVAYRLAREAFERDGRRIVDATDGGRCDIFEKKSLTEFL